MPFEDVGEEGTFAEEASPVGTLGHLTLDTLFIILVGFFAKQKPGVGQTNEAGLPVLCRAVSQIVGGITTVFVEENLGRHLEALKLGADVWAKSCPLCRMRGSLTCSELPPRTHLHHRRRVLPRSMCFRGRTTSPTSG